jgi:hypothetical protein
MAIWMVQCTDAERRGELPTGSPFILRGRGRYDIIIDIYRVLLLRQGSSLYTLMSQFLLGMVVICDFEETAITTYIYV